MKHEYHLTILDTPSKSRIEFHVHIWRRFLLDSNLI